MIKKPLDYFEKNSIWAIIGWAFMGVISNQ